jgi:hypothetical protein
MLSGTEFLQTLPATARPERERAILDAVRAGNFAPVTWWAVRSAFNGHALVMFVSSDALRIGTAEDSVRVNVTARTAQHIADTLSCVLPTTRICDLIWEQAVVRVSPCIGRADSEMSATSRMRAHHACVESKVGGQSGLLETVGKNWVLTNKLVSHPGRAANYGWFDAKAPYASRRIPAGGRGPHRLWQPLGLAHGLEHVDYSQTMRLVNRSCVVDAEVRDLVKVMRDSQLAPLVSDEGVLRIGRIPGVKPAAPLVASSAA